VIGIELVILDMAVIKVEKYHLAKNECYLRDSINYVLKKKYIDFITFMHSDISFTLYIY
jgi:hypothetical protein